MLRTTGETQGGPALSGWLAKATINALIDVAEYEILAGPTAVTGGTLGLAEQATAARRARP
jgi:hypothetical protein